MGLICKLKGHDWGKWGEWERAEYLNPSALEEYPHPEPDKQYIPSNYTYNAWKRRRRGCNRCGKRDIEQEIRDLAHTTIEDIMPTIEDIMTLQYTHIDADKVHNSEKLRDLVEISEDSPTALPPDEKDLQESINAHKKAQDRDVPVEIGDVITGGIEDISRHHSGSSDPIVRYEGFVIIVKKSPIDLSIGDIITVKITSFNGDNSANSVFVRQEDG